MFCSKCGFQNNQSDIFCKQCGITLSNNNQQPQPQNQFIQTHQAINNQQMNNFYNQQNINNLNEQQSNYENSSSINNSPNVNNGIYRLTLTRPKSFVGSVIKFKIFIDNNLVGSIKNGETVNLNIHSGNHTISFNKTMEQNINISSDTFADVIVIAGNKFGLSNIRNNNGQYIQNNELYAENIDKVIKSAKMPLIFSCACIAITFILLFTLQLVISPWMYGISIGYTIISLSSIKKNKQALIDKYTSLLTLNIISIIISIIGIIISGYLMIG